MKRLAIIGFAVSALLASGCSNNFTKEDAERITYVSVNPAVEMPEGASFQGVGAALGPGLVEMIDRAKVSPLEKLITDAGIDVRQMLYDEFVSKLQTTVLQPKLRDRAGHEIRLAVVDYGVIKAWGFSMRPLIKARVTMVDAAGREHWKKEAYIDGFTGKVPARKMEEWEKDPGAFKSAFSDGMRVVVEALLKGLESP
ncbi:MAG: hypothetical protein J0M16_06220 [Gammaproteobacteria bacterium]|nr:hypothetical protein [Gammaproteobacteria bacterium]